MRKKILTLLLCVLASMILITCGQSGKSTSSSGEKMKIVVTTFPIYDWVREVLGDNNQNVELSMIIDSGVDLHSFQPSTDDIIKISNADLFIYNGGTSEKWVDDALKQSQNKNMITVNLMEKLGSRAKEAEHVHHDSHDDHAHDSHDDHAHDSHDDHAHDSHDDHDHDHSHGHDDEHIWLSLINAKIFTDEIAASLARLNPTSASAYFVNAEAYKKELDELDSEYKKVIYSKDKDTIIIGDRFPFIYLFDDYGIKHYAAFSGCSAETEASFDTIKFLAEKANELNVKSIIKTEGTQHKIAETIANETKAKNQNIIVIDSIQSITADKVNNTKYLDIMKDNLKKIDEALSY